MKYGRFLKLTGDLEENVKVKISFKNTVIYLLTRKLIRYF